MRFFRDSRWDSHRWSRRDAGGILEGFFVKKKSFKRQQHSLRTRFWMGRGDASEILQRDSWEDSRSTKIKKNPPPKKKKQTNKQTNIQGETARGDKRPDRDWRRRRRRRRRRRGLFLLGAAAAPLARNSHRAPRPATPPTDATHRRRPPTPPTDAAHRRRPPALEKEREREMMVHSSSLP